MEILYSTTLVYVIELLIALALLTGIYFVKSHVNNAKINKALGDLERAIYTSVEVTNNTYVDELKKNGKFTLEEEEKAMNSTFLSVVTMLSEKTLKYIEKNVGDMDFFIKQRIEATVKDIKAMNGFR